MAATSVASIPLVPGLPLVGNLFAFRRDRLGLQEHAARTGPIARLQLGPLLGSLLFELLDVAAIVAMTGARLTAWHRKGGSVPLYLGGLVAFWAATSVALAGLRLAA